MSALDVIARIKRGFVRMPMLRTGMRIAASLLIALLIALPLLTIAADAGGGLRGAGGSGGRMMSAGEPAGSGGVVVRSVSAPCAGGRSAVAIHSVGDQLGGSDGRPCRRR